MSTTLARRIRRIGLLPQRKPVEVLDANQLTKLENAKDNPELQQQILDAVSKELLVRRLELTPGDLLAKALQLKAEVKSRRVLAFSKQAKPAKHRRSKSRRKVDGKKAA